ncbi:Beta-glucosidase 42 [Durusdinium trenchii]|uniref:Beta-glucosidase 42 n=1 Tax=Durusdinium trenchii TaxID=1381693 RepID=A0ABP0QKT1_9DINO
MQLGRSHHAKQGEKLAQSHLKTVARVSSVLPCTILWAALTHALLVWWHLPLVTLGLGGLAVGSKLLRLYRRSRRAKKAERILEELYNQLWDVSIRYLLSAEFAELAMHRTGKDDPTFIDMKTAFWLSDDPIGRDVICPRDGRAGCALVDWIPRNERREQSHFMSWTWKYSLRQVRSALEMLQHSRGTGTDPTGTGVSFFMCFFVNNQYRLIVEECANGSDNLEDVFEGHLKRIGRMVAILDTWDQPVYLSRVWTVYEQYVASTIGVQVQFVLPKNVADRLRHQIAYVPAGIEDIIESLCQVDSEQAKAWKLEDEIKVKLANIDTVGFKHVDMHVTDVMITWIGDVIEQTCTQWLVWRR